MAQRRRFILRLKFTKKNTCLILHKIQWKTEMNTEKIITKHPSGKSGRSIEKQKYEVIKDAILSSLENKKLTHTQLFDQLNNKLRGRFSGNTNWYGETVKLDLEARGIIERTDTKPQKYKVK